MAFSLHKEGGQFVFTLTTMTSKNLNTILNCLNTVKVKCPMLICLTLLLTVVAGAAREDHNNVYTSPRRLALLTFLVPPWRHLLEGGDRCFRCVVPDRCGQVCVSPSKCVCMVLCFRAPVGVGVAGMCMRVWEVWRPRYPSLWMCVQVCGCRCMCVYLHSCIYLVVCRV